LNGFGTHIVLPYRRYFDASFRASALLSHEGSYGLLFRYIDEFNYYAF